VQAQTTPVVNYLQQTRDYAEMYNGKLEVIYSVRLFKGFPYYNNSDFTDASVVYKNNYYPGQKARLDLYREQLIVLLPEKQYGVIVSSPNAEKVIMYDKTFVWLTPPKESGLKEGYYISLLDSGKIQLLCKESYTLQQTQVVYYTFNRNVGYYLFYNNQYYRVKDKGSFSKLFPQYKKQINQFAKTHQLNFKQKPDLSFTALAGYCEELITSTNKQ